MLLRNLAVAGLLLSFAAGFPAAAENGRRASFDCGKARTPVERAICDGNYTAELDRILDEIYKALLARAAGPKRAGIEAGQRRWLGTRNTRCGRAKPDGECLAGLYKDRIVALAREGRGLAGATSGAPVTARYAYRQKGEAGEMLLAEMPDGSAYVLIDTVNANHRSPHVCSFSARSTSREGDAFDFRDPEASKSCGLRVAVKGARATVSETPKDCFELARYNCGAHGYMLGGYARR